jgi:hypothetical protein
MIPLTSTIAIIFAVLLALRVTQQLVIKRRRKGISEQDLLAHFSRSAAEMEVAGQLHALLVNAYGVKFPILPQDRLGMELGIAAEDRDELAHHLAELCGRQLPEAPNPSSERFETVEDVVRTIAQVPRS